MIQLTGNMKVIFLIVMVMFILEIVHGASVQTSQRPPISDQALDQALNDKRYLMRQLKCAIGEAPCDPVGKRLKSLAPFVLRGSCPQCSPSEMKQIQKTLAHVQRNFPSEWNKLIQSYVG